ncbi:MAG: hypothetical protein LPK19_16190, partial [Hymenobacteraceae bacterium]|nr:hypothetical protein [Hymenobacteraceae bacterium]MDX5397787.1 hypothetical protein [Hymenobacteraceae bacterium]MDX5513863.1 hypothetical protein [Hymenobacteraceae bacterium]
MRMWIEKVIGLLLAVLAPMVVFAQKEPKPQALQQITLPTPVTEIGTAVTISPEHPISVFVQQQYPTAVYGELKPDTTIESTAANHLVFRQFFENLPVFQGSLKLSISKTGKLLSRFQNLYPLTKLTVQPAAPAPEVTSTYLKQKFGKKATFINSKSEQVWYVRQGQLLRGVLIRYEHPAAEVGAKEVLLNTQGEELWIQNLGLYSAPFMPKDTTIRAMVFLPDPLTSAQQTYNAPFIDSNDADVPVLNQQRQVVNLPVTLRNDTFYLENQYCAIRDFDTPVKPVCHDTLSALSYTRSSDCFEQVNILYHISTFQKHIQQLGFSNLQNQPIQVDAQGMNGLDQSRYSAFSNTLSYGEGGVDDGEDADVIIHEYFHAISQAAAPNTAVGQERRTLEEANADYFAASYSLSYSPFNWDRLYNWDGHNEYWQGRWATTTKYYPNDLQNDVYLDACIWTATLMQIRQDLGRSVTDKLLLQSLYSYAPQLTMTQAAQLFLQADTLLHGASNSAIIFQHFENRG